MYRRLGQFVARRWWLVCLAWLVLALGINVAAPPWDQITRDGDLAYLPERMTSVRGEKLLAEAFPDSRSKSQMVIALERSDRALDTDDLEAAESLADFLQHRVTPPLPLTAVWTPGTEGVGNKLLSKKRQAALVVLHLTTEFMATENIGLLARVRTAIAEVADGEEFPAGLDWGISGSAAIGGDMLASAAESIKNTELATVVLVLAILLLVYRAPLLALIPLATIGVSIAVATDAIALLVQLGETPAFDWLDFQVFKTTKIFIVVLLFGCGTDFCLFLIARYREELQAGVDPRQAVEAALGHVGEALVGSALTTILGLSMLVFADFGKYRNSGPAIALCLAVTLLACLTLAPAILRASGKLVFWPLGIRPARPVHERAGWSAAFWDNASRLIVRRPGLILVTSLALMTPFAVAGWDVAVSYDLLAELSPDRPSRLGTEMVQRHFPAGESGPMTILAYLKDGDFKVPAGKRQIGDLTRQLYKVDPSIVSVRSLNEPLGDRPRNRSVLTPQGMAGRVLREHARTRRTYLSQAGPLAGRVTRLDVVCRHAPFSPEARHVLDRIDAKLLALAADPASAWHGAEFDFVGPTAGCRDLRAVTLSDQTRIQRLVVLAVLFVLVVILRRPMICLYLILSVLFSYFVTIGATELVFAAVYPGFDGLDWKVPLFLFVILIAVGEDYNIYLATRVFEEQRRHGPLEGLRVAVVRTGGIITSCGVIMAGTFISMMLGSLRGMLELGFALSLGVLLDTIVVRPILVPAFLALVYRLRASAPPVLALEPQPPSTVPPLHGRHFAATEELRT